MEQQIVNPYIYTKLSTKISLRPDQMNNKIYINLKNNLTKKILNKCYKNYGYVIDIYKLDDTKNNTIPAENLSGSAVFDVTFSCKLCRVVENTYIICKVFRINRALFVASNGPIVVIITNDKINSDIFFTDHNNVLRYRDNNKSTRLEQGDFIVVNIINKEFYDKDDKIIAVGFLERMAKDEDIEKFFEHEYNIEEIVE